MIRTGLLDQISALQGLGNIRCVGDARRDGSHVVLADDSIVDKVVQIAQDRVFAVGQGVLCGVVEADLTLPKGKVGGPAGSDDAGPDDGDRFHVSSPF